MTTELGEVAAVTTDDIRATHEAHVINTYGTRKLAITKGQGCTLWDAEGREFSDFFSGWGVSGLGQLKKMIMY